MASGFDNASEAREFRLYLENSGKNISGDRFSGFNPKSKPSIPLNPGIRERRRREREAEGNRSFIQRVKRDAEVTARLARLDAQRNNPDTFKGTMKQQSPEEKEKVRQIQERARQEKLKRKAAQEEHLSKPKRARTISAMVVSESVITAVRREDAGQKGPRRRYRERFIDLNDDANTNPWQSQKATVIQPHRAPQQRPAPPLPSPSLSAPLSHPHPHRRPTHRSQPKQPYTNLSSTPPSPPTSPCKRKAAPCGDPLFMNASKRGHPTSQGIKIEPVPGSNTGNRTVKSAQSLMGEKPGDAKREKAVSRKEEEAVVVVVAENKKSPAKKKLSLADYVKSRKAEVTK